MLMNVLLVEDQSLDSDLMKKYLQKLGCTVTTAQEPQLAIKLLRNRHFNFVISDLNLSADMTGYELLQYARRGGNTISSPLILVTSSRIDDSLREKARHEGIYGIYQKWEGVIPKVREFVSSYKEGTERHGDQHQVESEGELVLAGNADSKSSWWRGWNSRKRW